MCKSALVAVMCKSALVAVIRKLYMQWRIAIHCKKVEVHTTYSIMFRGIHRVI